MAKALYRKYRPKTLGEVVGQEQVTRTLERAIEQGKISHAYLFVGPRGTGKTSVARIFAHQINGFNYELEDDYVDIIEIDGASNRGIEDIRELREKAAIAPSEGKFKVYIIDEVHMLTTQAFNALLKTLEEPPQHVVFVMATTDVHKVPKTILSRVQNYVFRLADGKTMREFLRKIADAEGIQITDEALGVVVRQGGGSFRDSLSVLDQVATLSDGEISRELVVSAMGLPEDEEVNRILESYNSGDLGQISGALREVLGSGIKPELLVEGLIRRIVAEPRPEWLGLLSRLPGVAAPFPDAKLLVALTANCAKPMGGAKIVAPQTAKNTQMNEGRPNAESAGNTATAVETSQENRTAGNDGANSETLAGTKSAETTDDENVDTAGFDWGTFVTRARQANEAVGKQLEKVKYMIEGNTICIYPLRKVGRVILSSANNAKLLAELAGGKVIKICDGEPDGAAKSGAVEERETVKGNPSKLDKISEALGGKVVEDGIEDPF